MKNRHRWLRFIGASIGLLLATGAGLLVFTLPPAAAAFCPSCYGFRSAAPDVFVEQGVSDGDGAVLVAIVKEGRQRVRQFWGHQESTPRVFVCSSAECFQRMKGGGRRGMSILGFAAVLSPRGIDPVIAAHELSMNELYHRIGWLGFVRQAVPVWFNEGLSMLASDDLRYLAPATASDRCLVPVPSTEALPTGPFEWNRQALLDKQLYAKAACATSRWIDAHGGASAAVELVSKVAAGMAFAEAAR
jgi:hypothetical protein